MSRAHDFKDCQCFYNTLFTDLLTSYCLTISDSPQTYRGFQTLSREKKAHTQTCESLNCISASVFSSTSTDNSWPSVIIRIGPSTSIAPRIGVITDDDDDDDGADNCEVCEASCSRRCLHVISHQRVTSARSSATKSVGNISMVICRKTHISNQTSQRRMHRP